MKLLATFLFFLLPFQYTVETIGFPSKDGIQISADVYAPHSDQTTPFIVLFHQAGWSRGEYMEIAPKLNAMGFNCLAVDLRSGDKINGTENETHKRAKMMDMPTKYVNSYQDIEAAVAYVRNNLAKGKIIIWGSSYSSSLVLKYAGDHQDVAGVLSFSPGEYFSGQGESSTWITEAAANIEVPVFITSAKNEVKSWKGIFDAIPSAKKEYFTPESSGNHGSRALWSKFDDSDAYWAAVDAFLRKNFL
jgi:dienelactone hydrolase